MVKNNEELHVGDIITKYYMRTHGIDYDRYITGKILSLENGWAKVSVIAYNNINLFLSSPYDMNLRDDRLVVKHNDNNVELI